MLAGRVVAGAASIALGAVETVLTQTLEGYATQLANWQSANWGGTRIDPQIIQGRELLLAILPNASQAQMTILQQIQAWAQSIGVQVTITIVQ
jgi:hypothetical protein